MNKNPLISIILPVYNASPYLPQCLNSVLSQTYQNWELIAVDDASTDNSLDILNSYAQKDSRLKILSHTPNQGIAPTLNQALKHAQGQFIARLDADDVMYPNRLQKQLNYLSNHPHTVVVGGQCNLIDTQDNLIGQKTFPLTHQKIYQLAFLRSPLQHPAIMINKNLLPDNFTWYHQNQVPAEDLDLYFRLFQYGRAANLPDTIIQYRQNPQGLSLKDPLQTYLAAYQIRRQAIKKYHYQPRFTTRLLQAFISLTIFLLPSSAIYPLYTFLTGFTRLQLTLPNLRPTFQLAKQSLRTEL